MRFAGTPTDLGAVGDLLAIAYVVWLLNLTNFMDGIDGIAGAEAVTVCGGGTLCSVAAAGEATTWAVSVVLAAATLGFLFWNWPPARVFMGDAGSGFLGFSLAGISLLAGAESPDLLWSWLILLGVFVVDASVTLIRRVLRGERFYVAHRNHAYQHASRLFGSHLPVTLIVCAINIGWLLPIALAAAGAWLNGSVALVIAYVPLLVAALSLSAGKPGPAPTPGLVSPS